MLPCPAGLYHLDEEVADLAQDDDEPGGRAVVLAVGADQAEGAHHPVQVGLQLREHGRHCGAAAALTRAGQSRGGSEPTRSLGDWRCHLYPDEEAGQCLVILPHITYLRVICLLHLFQQDPKRLQVEVDVLGFLQAWAKGETVSGLGKPQQGAEAAARGATHGAARALTGTDVPEHALQHWPVAAVGLLQDLG